MSKRKRSDFNKLQSKKIKSNGNADSSEEYISNFTEKIDMLLKGELNDEVLRNLENIINDIIQKEKNMLPDSLNYAFSSIAFEKTFRKLIELNEIDKSILSDRKFIHNEMIEKFVNIMLKIKRENVSIDILYNHFESFLDNLLTIQYLNNKVTEYLSMIAKYLNFWKADQKDRISLLIEKLIANLDYDQHFVLSLFDFLNQICSIKNREGVENILMQIFDSKNTNVHIKWSVKNLPNLVEIVIKLMKTYSIKNRSHIYNNIIEFFMKINTGSQTFFESKLSYIETEYQVIDILTNHFVNDGKKQSSIVIIEFINSLNIIVDKYSINALMNRFFLSLYVSIFSNSNKEVINAISKNLLQHLKLYVETIIICNENVALSACTKHSFNIIDLMNVLKYKRLVQLIEIDRLINGIINMCFEILYNYGTEIDEYKLEPTNTNEHLSLFVLNVLGDVFKNNKVARIQIISRFLDKCFEQESQITSENNKKIFINQLYHLINSSSSKKIYFDSANFEERSEINKLIMNRLNEYYASTVFKKKKNNLKQSNFSISSESIDSNLRLLDAISLFIFTSNKSDEDDAFFSLINSFRNYSIEKENHESIKLSISSLINIIKHLNRNHMNSINDNEIIFNNDYKRVRNKYLKNNSKITITILDHLKSILNSKYIDSSSKSIIYQSFSYLIKSNINLASYIFEFFFEKLDKLIIIFVKDNDDITKYIEKFGGFSNDNYEDLVYFNFEKAFSSSESNINFEPIDVIFNTIDLCVRSVTKSQQLQLINIPSLSKLNLLIKTISKTYVKKDSKFLYELYKNQLKNKYSLDASFLQIIHQLQVGIFDSLIEHSIENDRFDDLEKFIEKYEETELLFCTEIENIIQCKHNQHTHNLETSIKRKLDSNKQIISKKLKLNTQEDKENIDKNLRLMNNKAKTNKREPFSDAKQIDINQDYASPSLLKNTSSMPNDNKNSTKNIPTKSSQANISFLNIKFNRTPRISYTCCLKMIEICICSNNIGNIKTSRLINDVNLLKTLIQLISSEKFNQYVIKIIALKLESLSNVKASDIYNPESFDLHEIFDFLSSLWVVFCQRINGPDLFDISLFKKNIIQKFNQSFYNQTNQYIEFCKIIWQIVNKNFQKNRNILIRNERKYYASNDSDLWFGLNINNNQKKIRVYWKFLLCCSNNIKIHLTSPPHYQQIAKKIISSMLSLMNEILKTIKLNDKHYEMLIEWLYELANFDLANDKDISLLILNMLNYITCQSKINSIQIKYLSIDYSNSLLNNNQSENEISSGYSILCFNLLKSENLKIYEQVFYERLSTIINNFNWTLENSKYFDRNKLIELIIYEIGQITLSLSFILKSVSEIKSATLILKLLSEFYQFLPKFLKNFEVYVDVDIIFMLKKLIDSISYNLQSKLHDELNRIKDLIIYSDQEIYFKETKANNEEIINILKYKDCFSELINSISLFENEIIRLNDMIRHKDVFLLENYKYSIKNIQLNFDSRMTRTVSPNQLNKILEII